MTVGRLSFLCWSVFVVMSLAFLPLAEVIGGIDGLPGHTVVAGVVVALLWWGPFGYAMYLALVGIGKGDPRLLRRGVRGTAEVLSARPTSMRIQSGSSPWGGARVHRFRLLVSLPDRRPYETTCLMCEYGIGTGATVDVAASRWNHRRVTIDVGQAGRDLVTPRREAAIYAFSRLPPVAEQEPLLPPEPEDDPPSPGTERIHRLVELDRLHREGILNDVEYAAAKARVLDRGNFFGSE